MQKLLCHLTAFLLASSAFGQDPLPAKTSPSSVQPRQASAAAPAKAEFQALYDAFAVEMRRLY